MPLSHLHDLTDDVLARAARIRLACFDVDGTLTDGRLYLDSEGREQKTFHVQDGQGLVLLKRAGIEVAFITARGGTVAVARGRELGYRCSPASRTSWPGCANWAPAWAWAWSR